MDRVRARAKIELKEDGQPEPVPPGTPRRAALYDLKGREPGSVFRLLTTETYHNAAWLLNQLYLSLPRPDRKWAADCQTENFNARLWEAQLLASFREQGLRVTQPLESPDFRLENKAGEVAWVEAVTANPEERYEPVNARISLQPGETRELFFGPAAVRFAKTIGSKLQRNYHELDHVRGLPFVLALADFQAPASMMWSREALIGYLTGTGVSFGETGGVRAPMMEEVSHLMGPSAFPAGLFRDDVYSGLSAVIFSNACALSKFNRVMITRGAPNYHRRYVRYGKLFDRGLDVFKGVPFCLDVASEEYLSFWPSRHEPWCAELEVFHNPFAAHSFPVSLAPEATHWKWIDDEWLCRPYYETSILWSGALVMPLDDEMPTYETVPDYLFESARRRAAKAETD
ncbi:hypothetical protein ACEWB4_20385 [Sphingobium sp. sgz301303]